MSKSESEHLDEIAEEMKGSDVIVVTSERGVVDGVFDSIEAAQTYMKRVREARNNIAEEEEGHPRPSFTFNYGGHDIQSVEEADKTMERWR